MTLWIDGVAPNFFADETMSHIRSCNTFRPGLRR